jgi:predicted nucleic acid-binding protein
MRALEISESTSPLPFWKRRWACCGTKFQRDPHTIHDVRQKLTTLCNHVLPTQTLDVVKEDLDDNRVLECAAEASSSYIVTEDKDLLRLQEYAGIRVVNVADFMKIVVAQVQQKQ